MPKKTKTEAPATKWVEVHVHLKVPAGMKSEEIDEKLMEIVDAAERAGDHFWSDSRCDHVGDLEP